MADDTEDYKPPQPPTGSHRGTERALVVAFQQLPAFRPYALMLPGMLGRREVEQAAQRALGVRLEDPSMSRQHVRLARTNGGHVELECVSPKGISLNGWKVQQGERASLFGGEILRLGGTILVYLRELLATRVEDFRADDDIATSNGPLAGPYGLRLLRDEIKRLGNARPRVVLVHGETGTGKERVAHAIGQQLDARCLVTRNIAILAKEHVAVELFGVAAGAYTGVQARDGAVKEARDRKGALFLDEIGDLPHDAQAALLRFLQDGEVQVLGARASDGPVSKKIPVSVLLATHRDLDKLVANGAFRADLLARIQAKVEVPSLRARPEDTLAVFLELWRNRRPVELDRVPADAVEAMLLAWHEDNVRGLDRLVIEAAKFSTSRLSIDQGMVKRTLRNRGDSWWRAALCPSAVRAAFENGHRKKGSVAASQAEALAWLNDRAIDHRISEGAFKRFVADGR